MGAVVAMTDAVRMQTLPVFFTTYLANAVEKGGAKWGVFFVGRVVA